MERTVVCSQEALRGWQGLSWEMVLSLGPAYGATSRAWLEEVRRKQLAQREPRAAVNAQPVSKPLLRDGRVAHGLPLLPVC